MGNGLHISKGSLRMLWRYVTGVIALWTVVIGFFLALGISQGQDEFRRVASGYGFIWLMGMGVIGFGSRKVRGYILKCAQSGVALQQSYESLTAMMDSMDSLVYIADLETYEVLFINKYGKEVFGDLTGKICWKSLQAGQSGPCSFCTNHLLLTPLRSPVGVYVWEFQNTLNGRWYECRDQAIRWFDGRYVRMEIATDITERKRTEDRIMHLAQHDNLTDLPNRALFLDRLSVALAGAKRKKNKVAFLFVDLDNFKPINDTLGHKAGDLILTKVARRLKSCVREMDTVARFGGDEFTIVLADISDKSSVITVVEKILKSLSRSFKLKGAEASLSCSVGIALYPDHGTIPDELIKWADNAMYAVKDKGKNGYAFAKIESDHNG